MITKADPLVAEFVRVLVYVDEPQLLLLRHNKTHIVALAIPDEQVELAFVATTVSQLNWDRYIRGSVDLRYLFEYPVNKKLFHVDLDELSNGIVPLKPVTEIPDKFLPEPRFFSRFHTEKEPAESISVIEAMTLDGEWDLPDFTRMYAAYSDIYAFNLSLKKVDDQAEDLIVRRQIIETFSAYPWKGGFSSVYFYDHLYSAHPFSDKLNVESIQYASPGHLNINGRSEVFQSIRHLIGDFQNERVKINQKYEKIHRFLRNSKLLSKEAMSEVLSSATESFVAKESKELAQMLGIDYYDDISRMAGNRTLVAVKIVLSYFRRVNVMNEFFAEGRLAFKDDDLHQLSTFRP